MSRLNFHEELCDLLGKRQVYFQPPKSTKIKYDCFIYKLADIRSSNADNKAYKIDTIYEVTYITTDPDNIIKEEILRRFPKARFSTYYPADGLHHYKYRITYP